MNIKLLQFLSIVVSSLALLYLLFANLYRQTFVKSDWFVVVIDLFVKTFVDIFIVIKTKSDRERNFKNL